LVPLSLETRLAASRFRTLPQEREGLKRTTKRGAKTAIVTITY